MKWSDIVVLKISLMLCFFLAGCSANEIKVETEKLQSNKVVYPAHMYSGVLVKPSWNWRMGHGAGVRMDENLTIVEVRGGIEVRNPKSKDGAVDSYGSNEETVRNTESGKKEAGHKYVGGESVCEGYKKKEAGREELGKWNVHFKSGVKKSYDLDKLVNELSLLEPSVVSVVGYTDDVGDDTYNDKLSKHRAYSVSENLKQFWKGAEFNISWSGECPKIVLNTNETSRQRNRRVEIVAYK